MYDLTHPITDAMQTYPGDPAVSLEAVREFDSEGYRLRELGCGSHTGTHVDAPAHTERDGESLEELPLERFVLEAVRIDCRDLSAREPIGPDRVPETDADCVVFWTGWDDQWGTDRYLDHPYLSPEAARSCVEEGYAVGTDTLNPDPTPSPRAGAGEPTGVRAHHILLGDGRLIFENLTGLQQVSDRFVLQAYPLAIGGDGAPVRAVGVSRP